ncbi:MAG: hypothetical protein HY735_08605 [Verrucomicrobia bacterium]|nr:hypothetical protein [Verrucomicrobiota bacterium]
MLKCVIPSLIASWTLVSILSADPLKPIELWPREVPGEKGEIGEEKDMTKATDRDVAGRPVIRLWNVSKPTITIYRPPIANDTGAAVVVCPGGGYNILAWDLEGTEFYFLALKNAKVPAELHLYPTGGHGYGLRPSKNNVASWPKRAEEWMRALGILERGI